MLTFTYDSSTEHELARHFRVEGRRPACQNQPGALDSKSPRVVWSMVHESCGEALLAVTPARAASTFELLAGLIIAGEKGAVRIERRVGLRHLQWTCLNSAGCRSRRARPGGAARRRRLESGSTAPARDFLPPALSTDLIPPSSAALRVPRSVPERIHTPVVLARGSLVVLSAAPAHLWYLCVSYPSPLSPFDSAPGPPFWCGRKPTTGAFQRAANLRAIRPL